VSLNETEQIKKLLEDKKNILITFRKNGNDAIASAVALSLFLEKLGKRVDIVCPDFVLPKALDFLPKAKEIRANFPHLQKFVINLDIEKTGVEELSYDIKEQKLRLFITPKQGFLTRDNVHTAQSDFKYELIFVLDTPDLETLGNLYDHNTELFYKKPIINLDHSPANEHYGQVNFIDTTVSSTAEVIYQLINNLARQYLDPEIATALLTSMIIKTKSFKSPDIKPQTLDLASKLISLGGKRDYIVQNLYRTKSITTLKLWGTALSHLQQNVELGLVYTSLTRDDFSRAGAVVDDLKDIIDELISNSPAAKMILLLSETPEGKINCVFTCEKQFDALNLLRPFFPTGHKQRVTFSLNNKTLSEAEETIISQIKKTVSI